MEKEEEAEEEKEEYEENEAKVVQNRRMMSRIS